MSGCHLTTVNNHADDKLHNIGYTS